MVLDSVDLGGSRLGLTSQMKALYRISNGTDVVNAQC
jgi:hypothetical protein